MTASEGVEGSKKGRFSSDVIKAPKNIPPIFDGNQLVVFGMFPPDHDKPTGVKIVANSPDGPLSLEIPITENNNLGKTQMLHKLAVIKLIRELELEETTMRNIASIKETIIALGIEHGITSKHTSYIAVDESDHNLTQYFTGRMQQRQIPTQLPFGGFSSSSISSYCPTFGMQQQQQPQMWNPPQASFTNFPQTQSFLFGSALPQKTGISTFSPSTFSSPQPQGGGLSMFGAPSTSAFSSSFSSSQLQPGSSCTFGPAVTPKTPQVMDITNQQNFDGSFSFTEALCRAINISYDVAKMELTNYGWDEYVWATCLAITALATSQDFKDQKDLWELIANKAQKWLAQQVPDASILQGIMKTAEFCLHN